ncbi:uncharacterized protein N7459_003606 [Penicillium hispanicum]|uniref:uncharacterized protein n=1 Tax=Penicillium hispanicum TaxID=1080232 RepID=UPI0025425FFF|nr:uncharacterized protein N7459_003606 [Penicillium hispanicum]KAJ5587841.1 hypothetical protein N7459_003606 [Penicillium hispanicum]
MSPFVRPHAPELELEHGFTPTELAEFIDGLNEAYMTSHGMQMTSAVGTIIGKVPIKPIRLLGRGVNLAAGAGTAGVSMLRTKQYMKKANERIFKPKGLYAQICKTDKMLEQVGMVDEAAAFSRTQYDAIMHAAEPDGSMRHPMVRRMEAFGGRVVELSFEDAATPVEADDWVHKVGAYTGQRAEQKQLGKLRQQERKLERKSSKAAERERGKIGQRQGEVDVEIEKIVAELQGLDVQIQNLDAHQPGYNEAHRELQREHGELEQKLRPTQEKRSQIGQMERQRGKEHKPGAVPSGTVNKILWIVITAEEKSAPGDDDWDSDKQTVSDKKSD